jgi:hypothetical protein
MPLSIYFISQGIEEESSEDRQTLFLDEKEYKKSPIVDREFIILFLN